MRYTESPVRSTESEKWEILKTKTKIMISKKEAKKLGRPMTIDMREKNARQYIESKKSHICRVKENTYKIL